VNKQVDSICSANGIIQQRTSPYSPQQNDLAEGMNRTVLEMARSMMHYKAVHQ
jgi:hypothetical protein